MPDEVRVNRPTYSNRPDGPMNHDRGESVRVASKMPWIVLALVVLALLVCAALFRNKLFNGNDVAGSGKASDYQSVFLTNGQVYFGKLSHSSDMYVTLTDIYYLQVTQPPLQGSQTNTQQQQQQQLSLVKLGNELHGPVDSMQINRDQILFFENMKDDGKVVQAIREYQKNPNQNNTTQTPSSSLPESGIPTTQTPVTQTPTATPAAKVPAATPTVPAQ